MTVATTAERTVPNDDLVPALTIFDSYQNRGISVGDDDRNAENKHDVNYKLAIAIAWRQFLGRNDNTQECV